MSQSVVEEFFKQVAENKDMRKTLERSRGQSEFVEQSIKIGRSLKLDFTAKDLSAAISKAVESADKGKGFEGFGPLQAWTDGCGGSICTLTAWTNTYSGCGNVADLRKKAGIR